MTVKPSHVCPKCGIEHQRLGQKYCLACHAAYQREWRKTHPLNKQQRHKDNCRSYAGIYKHRGHLTPEPCAQCGDENSQMHHDDYDRPLEVAWLCRPCHLKLHQEVA